MSEVISNHRHQPIEYLKLFIFTVEEYRKVTNVFDGNTMCSEQEYSVIQIKLTLLRKYETKSDAVYLKNVVKASEILYPLERDFWDVLNSEFNELESDNTELLLSDGTTRKYREAIEDIMYGLFLHADKNRCEYIMKTDKGMYLFLVKKYVAVLEKLVNSLYDKLKDLGVKSFQYSESQKASVIFAGKDSSQKKEITNDSYWSNLRGRNMSDNEIQEYLKAVSNEDKEVLSVAILFLNELKKDVLSKSVLNELVFPPTRSDWGDFRKIQEEVKNIDIGYSLKVRYHEKGDMAYIRIFKNLKDVILINQPQYSPDIATITLVNESDKLGWRVYSIGDDPGYYKQSGSLKDYIKYLIRNRKRNFDH